jgi:SnoaL-like domain
MAIQRSPGVCDLIEAIWATADAQDGERMSQLYADDPNLLYVGVAPAEAWHGFAEVTDALRAAHDGTAPVGFRVERCLGFEEGDTGWGVGDGFLIMEGRDYPFRLAVVARRSKSGSWESVFSQAAIPIRDDAFSEALAEPETD